MAPRGKRADTEESQSQAFHELGVRGRKTGAVLAHRDDVDEMGMRPIDDLFSSPRKSVAANGGDDSGSEDMEIASSGGPGPRTMLQERRSLQYPIPRSRSPLKTNSRSLQSPARRVPAMHLKPSSPLNNDEDDVDATVTRKLDFNSRAAAKRPVRPNGVNRRSFIQEEVEEEEEDEDEDEDEEVGGEEIEEDEEDEEEQQVPEEVNAFPAEDEDPGGFDDEPFDAIGVDDYEVPREEPYDEDEEEEEEELPAPPKPASVAPKRPRGRPRKSSLPPPESPDAPRSDNVQRNTFTLASRVGRPGQSPKSAAPSKKRRHGQEEDLEEAVSPPKRPRTAETALSKGKGKAVEEEDRPKPKGKPGRKPRSQNPNLGLDDAAGESSFMALQRGPPMPKSRGLVSYRRDAAAMFQTRSGRHSYKPVDYWRGEEVVQNEEEAEGHEFVLSTIKEVLRVPEDTLPSKRAPQSKTRNKSKQGSVEPSARRPAEIIEEDEELEEWELDPGTIRGEVVLWEPEHEIQPPTEDDMVNIAEEQIAISADSIQTSDVRDSTFRFAKTLTMPFMGAGVVDLPPGSEKRPKNSRKMHMVFFVHYGKVMVSVNEAQFRISAGGTWFVPRGNYYSITNDYENPARVFFSQACEMQSQSQDMTEYSYAE